LKKIMPGLLMLLATNVLADGFPVNITTGASHYSDVDKDIAANVRRVIADDPDYKLVKYPHIPRADLIIGYTDLDDGVIAASVVVVWNASGQKWPAYLGGGSTSCTAEDQTECLLGTIRILESAVDNFHHPGRGGGQVK
jgi:hypothetical protein